MKFILITFQMSVILLLGSCSQTIPNGIYTNAVKKHTMYSESETYEFSDNNIVEYKLHHDVIGSGLRGNGSYKIKRNRIVLDYYLTHPHPESSFSFAASSLETKDSTHFKMVISDTEGNSLIGVNICLYDENNHWAESNCGVTNSEGVFETSVLKEKKISYISVNYVGFDNLKIPVENISGTYSIKIRERMYQITNKKRKLPFKKYENGLMINRKIYVPYVAYPYPLNN